MLYIIQKLLKVLNNFLSFTNLMIIFTILKYGYRYKKNTLFLNKYIFCFVNNLKKENMTKF